MRIVVFGAGAVGGVIGARLFQAGNDVVLIARGPHAAAIERDGLTLVAPGERVVLRVPVARSPVEVDWADPAVVLLATKGQDTLGAVADLAAVVPPTTPVVCAQNGVENERRVLRRFARTYGICVMCATTHLEAGVVEAHYAPVTGLMDIGRYPDGEDDVTVDVAAALRDAGFGSVSRPDIMYWKYRKLISNLANAVEALCGPGGGRSRLADAARAEGERCLRAANIDVASVDEDAERRRELRVGSPAVSSTPPARSGGSTWQSLERRAPSVEAEFLNGEVVLLGRLTGVPTPVNELLMAQVERAARTGEGPGRHSPDELLDRLPPGSIDGATA
ncbi:MAG TPA: 2-dehydropantoate 2-reductase [Acidimicrobiales bacterium]